MTTPALTDTEVDREQLAWAAGLFDGEGHIRCDYNPTRRWLQMTVWQKDPRVLLRFQQAVGCGNLQGPYHHTGQPIWRWQAASFETVQAVVAKLWAFLDIVKREQASTALKRWHRREQAA